ncbi:GntP family permease [Aliifodinibius salicampi]|uniref:GntP family permease n=1 Tax=Fodinibius salicampi TaxID=1920655 RepID=A0ABT3PYV6_9BACT|nr:GntP family permease [Fodinibius salicampi]MCW9713042.1 GntP family permease [Fodinibius salicampi]
MVVIYLLLSIVLIILLTARYQVHPFIVLFLVSLFYGLCSGMPLNEIIESVNSGFGDTLGSIGLLIILGVIIGAFLENSGGAYKIADKVLNLTGKKRVPTAMGIIGYFVSIPVFADSAFILLSPLNKSLSKKAKITLSGSAVALALGLTVTHTLVPPTPGPIAAAGILNADLGLVMMLAIPVSAIALVAALIYSTQYVSKTYIDPIPEVDQEEMAARMKKAPGAFKSSLPVFVPIILIVLRSIVNMYEETINAEVANVILFMGEPFIALLIGMFLAFLLPQKLDSSMLSTSGWVGKALKDATSIILITGAGGIFGKVLQNSGIAEMLGQMLSDIDLSIWLPFLLAAAIKTAQGSSTVALITAASIMTPMMETLGFVTEIEKAIVVLAIGAGSSVFSHANDSFFWVVTQLTGMDTKMGYRLFSLGTFVLGLTAATTLFIIYLFIG